jgi:hypothetical protein
MCLYVMAVWWAYCVNNAIIRTVFGSDLWIVRLFITVTHSLLFHLH